MGMSIDDRYAAQFSACFYRGIAEKQSILTGFNEAVTFLKEKEHDDLVQMNVSNAVPLQWIIPNLYLSRPEGKIKVILEADKIDKGLDKFVFLVFAIAENQFPVFIFDNLESFQSKPGEEMAGEYSDLREIIDYLCKNRKFHMVLIGRYRYRVSRTCGILT